MKHDLYITNIHVSYRGIWCVYPGNNEVLNVYRSMTFAADGDDS